MLGIPPFPASNCASSVRVWRGGQPRILRDIPWKAQLRISKRWRRDISCKKPGESVAARAWIHLVRRCPSSTHVCAVVQRFRDRRLHYDGRLAGSCFVLRLFVPVRALPNPTQRASHAASFHLAPCVPPLRCSPDLAGDASSGATFWVC